MVTENEVRVAIEVAVVEVVRRDWHSRPVSICLQFHEVSSPKVRLVLVL
jgi:hypothetical protein